MSSKHSHVQHSAVPIGADNLQRIHGIGPGIAQRLHEAGLLTFAQLAALSADDIAALLGGVAGLSGKSIAAQDWIGQARALATAPPATDEAAARTEGLVRQHYATFTVELLLDEANLVRRTHVTHVQGGTAETWAGWPADRLVEFLAQQAGLVLASADRDSAPTSEAAPTPVAMDAPPSIAATARPQLRIRQFEPIPQGADEAHQFLRYSEPYELRLTLDVDLALEDALRCGHFGYTAAVYAKSLSSPARRIVGEVRGTEKPADSIIIAVPGTPLPRDIYRLEAIATLTLPGDSETPNELTAFLESGLLQVY
jgi:hypothetical protein